MIIIPEKPKQPRKRNTSFVTAETPLVRVNFKRGRLTFNPAAYRFLQEQEGKPEELRNGDIVNGVRCRLAFPSALTVHSPLMWVTFSPERNVRIQERGETASLNLSFALKVFTTHFPQFENTSVILELSKTQTQLQDSVYGYGLNKPLTIDQNN